MAIRLEALVVGLVIAALAGAAASAPAAVAQQPAGCGAWQGRTVQTGLGRLENLEFDGRGGLLLSVSDGDSLRRLLPDGASTVFAAGIESPGGLRAIGPHLYANSDNSAQAALTNSTAGTIERFDLETGGGRMTYARGLTMPNGLVVLPGGDALVSRALGTGTGITRIRAQDPARPQSNWAKVDGTNGLAVSPDGRFLYAVKTFTQESPVLRIDLADPSKVQEVARLSNPGVPNGLDDITIDADGVLYMAANGTGEIVRLDPATKRACVIATGLRQPSAVKFGCGPGWPRDRLYAVGFDGTVRELTPPAGVVVSGKAADCAATAAAPPGTPGAAPAPPPSLEPCRSRRAFSIRLRRPRGGGRIAGVRVTVGGRRVRVRRRGGRLVVRVDLRNRPRGRVTVRAVGRTTKGRRYVDRRVYRTCAPRD